MDGIERDERRTKGEGGKKRARAEEEEEEEEEEEGRNDRSKWRASEKQQASLSQ